MVSGSGSSSSAAPKVRTNSYLHSSCSSYSVLNVVGQGCFGKVAKCQNLHTKELVAVKILKPDLKQDITKEVYMLQLIGLLNPDHNNFVRFFEEFQYMGRTCLVFEILEKNLTDLIKERNNQPLSLREIRPVAKQLLVALKTLWNVGVLHTDIKPDNVMLVNSKEQPLRIKLIDFGLAIFISKAKPGMLMQPIGYRAPEIALGLPFTEAIDVWGVGCTLAFLYLADNLFPVDCDFQMMKCIVEVLGQPQDRLLNGGIYTHNFFKKSQERLNELTWRLMTSEEYKAVDNRQTKTRKASFDLPSSLDDLVNIYPTQNFGEMEDRLAFVDLLKQLLHLDGRLRISAYQALNLPFITMIHITSPFSRAYLRVSQNIMAVCSDDKLVERMRSCSCSDSSCCNKEPESGFYEEARLYPRSDEESDEWISEAELSSVCSNHDTSAGFSCRAESEGTSTDGLKTPSDVSRSFDGEVQPVSLHLRPDFCLFCRDQASDNPTDGHHSPLHPTHVLAEQDLRPASVVKTPGPSVSVGRKTPSAHEPAAPPVQPQLFVGELPCVPCGQSPPGDYFYKTSAAKPSPDGSGATPSCSVVTKGEPAQSSVSDALIQTAPPKRHFTVLKRIRKFLSRIAACVHSRSGHRPSKMMQNFM